MSKSEIRSKTVATGSVSEVEMLAEDVRITALNIAITAAKLKIAGEPRTVLRKCISDLVTLSLDTIGRVAAILDSLKRGFDDPDSDPEQFAYELEEIRDSIRIRSEEILGLFERYDQRT
jgi:hypothetical protein